MRINIRVDLERPMRDGQKQYYTHIICKKEEADDKASGYIWDYTHNRNLIRAVMFDVFFRDHRGKLVHRFQYKPTYPRD